MKTAQRKEFVIGLSVIVALVVLFFGIEYLKGVNLFKPSNFYYAEYENVAGLEIAAPVTVDGFKVGQVRDIQFNYDNPGKIKVLLALNKDLHIPDDSYATITSSLLNGAAIDIVLGHSKQYAEIGSTLKTQMGSDLMASLSEGLMPQVQSILPKIDTLLVGINRVVAHPALLQSIERLDGISGNVLDATAGLRSTLNSDLPIVMRNAGKITTSLDTVSRDLTVLSRQLRSLPLEPTLANVQSITKNLDEFSRQLNDPNSTLGLLMRDPELYRRLTTVAADVDSLLVDLKRNPKRYISIKLL